MSIEIKYSRKPSPYKKAMLFLNKRVEQVKNGDNNELIWVLEHPKTYTAGVSFKKNEIIDKKTKIIKTNRGGKITLHNPGQRIIYFVINLNSRKKDIRKLINAIEITIIEFLKFLKIKATKDKKNIGIWVKEKKIAAIGLRVSRWVAFHGFSINIDTDLAKYNSIIPCGIKNKGVTNLKEIVDQNYDQIENKIIENFILNLKDLDV